MNDFERCLYYFPLAVQKFITEPCVDNLNLYINTFDVNSRCSVYLSNDTVLMFICKYGYSFNPLKYTYYIHHAVEKVKWLLAAGANPNLQNQWGDSALMHAACNSSPKGLSKKQCINAVYNKYKIDPIKQRINKNIYLMIATVFQKRENFINPKSSEETVKILLATKGVDPNIKDHCGWTALMIAACYSSPHERTERCYSSEKTVKILLDDKRVDPNIQNAPFGYTALMLAACNSSPERGTSSEKTVKILLTVGGSDPDIQNEDGYTALMIAVDNSSPKGGTSSEKTVKLLRDAINN